MSAPTPVPEIPLETKRNQWRASNPEGSAFVFANAGSGKTYVLAARVLRLLLSGAEPGRLLCLTFTKAAAAEMAGRVLKRLSDWAVMEDQALAEDIAQLNDRPASRQECARARGLFARALDTPGGLKVQTIHAFCERLLHAFPLEADVAAAFRLMSDSEAAHLFEAARDSVVLQAHSMPGSALGKALSLLMTLKGDDAITQDLKSLQGRRGALSLFLADGAAGEAVDDRFAAKLRLFLGIQQGRTSADLHRAIAECPFLDGAMIAALSDARYHVLKEGVLSGNVYSTLEAAVAARDASTGMAKSQAILDLLFTNGKPRSPRSRFTKAFLTGYPAFEGLLEREIDRVTPLFEALSQELSLEASMALFTVYQAINAQIERTKAARGLLDFDDLITRTAALLTRKGAADWVRYKLDAGIDHILVDEAQDTSVQQWRIIMALSSDFFAGEGSRVLTRTFFAVGDKKQSIFSFQGAAPELFSRAERDIKSATAAVGHEFAPVPLTLSFRSAPTILEAVDGVFNQGEAGIAGVVEDEKLTHQAFKRALRGRVEVWPLFGDPDNGEPTDWTASPPTDVAAVPRLAGLMADRIAALIEAGTSPGEIMVLMRKRGALFRALNKTLKARGVPVAGLDRFRLTDELAIRDLMALFSVLLLPEDDLSLAVALRSPLFGLGEATLERLAVNRKGTLYGALEKEGKDDPAIAAIHATLEDWRARTDYERPFELTQRILVMHGCRKRFAERLGPEVDDIFDAFLDWLLEAESEGVLTLSAAEALLEKGTEEQKRDMDASGQAVRIVTVHSSKGLEARHVFLCETTGTIKAPNKTALLDPRMSAGEDAPPFLLNASLFATPAIEAVREAMNKSTQEEYNRLLYVAMTRAEESLVITGHFKKDKPREGSWYTRVREGLAPMAQRVVLDGFDEDVLVLAPPDEEGHTDTRQPAQGLCDEARPDLDALVGVLRNPAPPRHRRPERLKASAALEKGRYDPLGTANVDARLTREEAQRQGTLLHRLLQFLPDKAEQDRRALAIAHLEANGLSAPASATLAETVLAVLDAPEMAFLFGPESRAEVDLTGTLAGPGGTVHAVDARLDRLVIGRDAIHVADFKTASVVPERDAIGETIVAQLAIYRALLESRFPGLPVHAHVVWTAAPRLDTLPAARLDAALLALLRTREA